MIKILDDDIMIPMEKGGKSSELEHIESLVCVCVRIAFECEFWSCVLRETLDRIVLHK